MSVIKGSDWDGYSLPWGPQRRAILRKDSASVTAPRTHQVPFRRRIKNHNNQSTRDTSQTQTFHLICQSLFHRNTLVDPKVVHRANQVNMATHTSTLAKQEESTQDREYEE